MKQTDCTSIIRLHLMYNKKKATAYLFCYNGEIKKYSFKRDSDEFFTKSAFIYEALTQQSPAKCFEKLEEGFIFMMHNIYGQRKKPLITLITRD